MTLLARTDKINDHFDLLDCHLQSAHILRASAFNHKPHGSLFEITEELRNSYLITSFFLYRHSLELLIKALIKEITGKDITGHNIKKLWEENIPNHENIFTKEIQSAIRVLEKYKVLNDEELYRYYINKNGFTLKKMPHIVFEDFEALIAAIDVIRHAVLEQIHVQNGCPNIYSQSTSFPGGWIS